MRGAAALAAAACWLSGCGETTPPKPRIISIEPSSMASSEAVDVVIAVDAVLPFEVNYGTGDVTVSRSLLVTVGRSTVGNGRYENDGRLPGLVPSQLQPGAHDVTVTLSDNRTDTLSGAFIVTAGNWPANGFTIDPIANVQAGVTFEMTIRAQGAFSTTFTGTVDYTISDVINIWTTTGKFGNGGNGVRLQNVTIPAPLRGPTHITVTDLLGRIAVSNTFNVN